MYKDKEKAISLRLLGKSYNEISRQLTIPKSTLSSWFRKETWPKDFLSILWNKNKQTWARNITRFNKERAKQTIEQARKEQNEAAKLIGRLSRRELLLVAASLYWAEGAKVDRWKIFFVNSDPLMISLMMHFFRNIMKISEEKLKMSVQVHPNISERKAKAYWANIVSIPVKEFEKTLFQISKASKRKRPKRTLPHGTCRISINGVRNVNKLKGWIQGIANQSKIPC